MKEFARALTFTIIICAIPIVVHARVLLTDRYLKPETYEPTSEFGGSARSDLPETTAVALGDWRTSMISAPSSFDALNTYTLTTTEGHLWLSNTDISDQGVGDTPGDVAFDENVVGLSHNAPWDLVHRIPEVSTWEMMLLGLAGLGFATQRSRKGRLAPAFA